MSIAHIIEQNTQPETNRDRGDRPVWKPEWNLVGYLVAVVKDGATQVIELRPNEDFKPYAQYLAVSLTKSSHKGFKNHRFSLGTILNDGRFVPSFGPRVSNQRSGQPELDEGAWLALSKLVEAAKEWQGGDAAFQCDHYVAYTSGPEKVGQKVTGKTERERAKGKARPKTG